MAREIPLTAIYIALFLMIVMVSISFISSDYLENMADIVQLNFLLLFILGSARMHWNRSLIKLAGYIFGIATLLIFLHWVQSGLPMFGFKSVYRNENYLAVLLFSFFYFNSVSLRLGKGLERVLFLAITFINIVLIAATSARSVFISLLSVLVFWAILKFYRPLFNKLIYIVLAGNFLFIGLYVLLSKIQLGTILNEWSRSLFNKNLFSGRTEIWIGVMNEVVHKPFFGYGVGVKASHIADTHLTTHNMYLQILLEFGIIGVILFVFLLIAIWRVLVKRLDHFVVRFSSCFLLGILIYLSFEVTLFQNNYSIALFQWLIMTIGIHYKDHH